MLQLETFGGLTLSDTGGAPAPTSRLRLALLTLLAASGGRGLSRDKILAYLWPESSPENARHALEQLLYSLRRQIPVEIVTGGDPLRLNPAAVVSDVGLFEHKLAAKQIGGHVPAVLPSAYSMMRRQAGAAPDTPETPNIGAPSWRPTHTPTTRSCA